MAVDVVSVGSIRPAPEPARLAAPEGVGLELPPAYQCSRSPGAGLIPPARLRRLGRAQAMALAAARLAVSSCELAPPAGSRTAVSLGTALGELDETACFLENMIRLEEREPMPARFINSVHNCLASQIAITFGWTGENHTFVHNAISFESALWQAMRVLVRERADYVLAGGADVVNPYAAALGRTRGWYRAEGGPLAPLEAPSMVGSLPGEGAQAFVLSRPGLSASRLARIAAVRARALPPGGLVGLDAGREIAFIAETIAGAGVGLEQIPLVLLGANGDAELDGAYRRVMAALDAAVPAPPVFAVYKQHCGEYCTAPAFGLSLAVEVVRTGQVSDTLCRQVQPPSVMEHPSGESAAVSQELDPQAGRQGGGLDRDATRPVRTPDRVLLYHLSASGFHSVMLVTA